MNTCWGSKNFYFLFLSKQSWFGERKIKPFGLDYKFHQDSVLIHILLLKKNKVEGSFTFQSDFCASIILDPTH